MRYFAVIDTNVIVSAMLKPDSVPGTILKFALADIITPLVNDEILREYNNVVRREKFGFDESDIGFVLSNLVEKAIFLDRTKTNDVFVDQKDLVFYEITLTAKSKGTAFLITGNIKHFPREPFVVTPKEMLDIIDEQKMLI